MRDNVLCAVYSFVVYWTKFQNHLILHKNLLRANTLYWLMTDSLNLRCVAGRCLELPKSEQLMLKESNEMKTYICSYQSIGYYQHRKLICYRK